LEARLWYPAVSSKSWCEHRARQWSAALRTRHDYPVKSGRAYDLRMGWCEALLPESRPGRACVNGQFFSWPRTAWRRRQPAMRNHASAGLFSRSLRIVFPLPAPSRPRDRADCARVLPAPQCRAVGGDHTAPDTVLADFPKPQRQFQALGAYKAGDADGDRRGRLVAGPACFRTSRKPLVGIEAAVSAAGVPDDPGPQGLIGQRDGRRRIRWPGSGPVQGVGSRPVIRRRGGA